MEIHQIKESPINDHANLLIEVFSQPPWCESWAFENAHDRLLCYKNTPYFLGLSAIENGELTGFIFGNYEPYQKSSQFIIKEMCVKTNKQRTGVGKKLLTELNYLLKKNKTSTSCLLTRKASTAELFYLDNGYLLSESMGLYFRKTI